MKQILLFVMAVVLVGCAFPENPTPAQERQLEAFNEQIRRAKRPKGINGTKIVAEPENKWLHAIWGPEPKYSYQIQSSDDKISWTNFWRAIGGPGSYEFYAGKPLPNGDGYSATIELTVDKNGDNEITQDEKKLLYANHYGTQKFWRLIKYPWDRLPEFR